MSHFLVMVVGANPGKQLQPFHEFECTGTNDQYVQDVDRTEEARKDYAKATTTLVKDALGNLHDPYKGGERNDRWYYCIENGERPFPQKEWKLRTGYTEVEVPTKERQSFAEFVEDYFGVKLVAHGSQPDLEDEHKFGYALLDQKGEVLRVVRRTNPNAKWDWYALGGRWAGYFKLKPGARGLQGRPGLMTDPAEPGTADAALKRDIDFEAMRGEAAMKAAQEYDAAQRATGSAKWVMWKEMKQQKGFIEELPETATDEESEQNQARLEEARSDYNAQPPVKALRTSRRFGPFFDYDDLLMPREQYLRRAREGAVTTFAVLKDGQWYERGEMGWWGVVSNEKEDGKWNEEFAKLLDSLPADTLLSAYDCHI